MKMFSQATAVLSLTFAALGALPGCAFQGQESEPEGASTDQATGETSEALSTAHCWVNGSYYDHTYNWCLTKCTGDSSGNVWVVGTQTEVGGYGKCGQAAEWFCSWNGMVHATNACWGTK